MIQPADRQYAPLAPLLAFAGIFVHPMASTLLPFILYVLFRSLNKPFAMGVALRTMDMAFTIQFVIIFSSLIVRLLLTQSHIATQQAQQIMSLLTLSLLAYFFLVLLVATIQATRGREFGYWGSFRLAERFLRALNQRRK